MKSYVLGSTIMLALTIGSTAQATPIVPDGYVLEQVATGLSRLNDVYRDHFGRLLIVEAGDIGTNQGNTKDGTVSEVKQDGTRTIISSGYYNPSSILVGYDGSIFVSDVGAISTTGDGDGVVWVDRNGIAEELSTGYTTPLDMVFDPSDSAYILLSELSGSSPLPFGDTGIYRIDSVTGTKTVFFNDGAGSAPTNLTNIGGLTIDDQGNIYAADNETHNIHRITSASNQIPLIDVGYLDTPRNISFDKQGNLYIADATRNTVFLVSSDFSLVEPFVTNVILPVALLVEEDAIYFSEDRTTLWKVALPNQCENGFTQADIDAAIEVGKQSGIAQCQNDPTSCGITPDDGITQTNVDSAYQSGMYAGISQCQTNPASCSIISTGEKFINISTRTKILGGADNPIAGFIIQGTNTKRVVVTARGESVAMSQNLLCLDTKMTVYKMVSGSWQLLAENDDWQADSRASEIPAHLQPAALSDAALLLDLEAGAYTAVMSCYGGLTGVGIIAVNGVD